MSKENESFFEIEEKEINLQGLLLTLKRRQSIIYGTVLLSLILVTLYILIVPPVYHSSFIVKVPVITSGEASKIMQEFNLAIKEKNLAILAERLELSEEKAKKIVKLVSGHSSTLRSDLGYIEISLDVNDPGMINELKDNILIFLNKNKYINERVAKEKGQLNLISHDIQSRIKDIENFRNILADQIKSGSRTDIGFNPMGMERDVIEFKKELRSVEDKMELLKGFELLTEPYIPQEPIIPNKKKYLAITAFLSVISGVLLAFFVEGINKFRESSR